MSGREQFMFLVGEVLGMLMRATREQQQLALLRLSSEALREWRDALALALGRDL